MDKVLNAKLLKMKAGQDISSVNDHAAKGDQLRPMSFFVTKNSTEGLPDYAAYVCFRHSTRKL